MVKSKDEGSVSTGGSKQFTRRAKQRTNPSRLRHNKERERRLRQMLCQHDWITVAKDEYHCYKCDAHETETDRETKRIFNFATWDYETNEITVDEFSSDYLKIFTGEVLIGQGGKYSHPYL